MKEGCDVDNNLLTCIILCILPNEPNMRGTSALLFGKRAKFLSTLIRHTELFAVVEKDKKEREIVR